MINQQQPPIDLDQAYLLITPGISKAQLMRSLGLSSTGSVDALLARLDNSGRMTCEEGGKLWRLSDAWKNVPPIGKKKKGGA